MVAAARPPPFPFPSLKPHFRSRKFLFDSSTTERYSDWQSDEGVGRGTVYTFRNDRAERSIGKVVEPSALQSDIATLNTDIIKGKSDIKNLQESARVLSRSRAQTVQIDQ